MKNTKTRSHKAFVVIVGIAAALAGLLFGVDVGVINGAKVFIENTFHLGPNSFAIERIVSGVLYGAVLGTFLSGPLSRWLGRRMVIILSAIIFCIGALLCAFAPSANALMWFRIFLGLAVGMASFTAPLYLSEIAPKQVRGGLVALYQFMITLGILAAYISDLFFTSTGNWRMMLGITFVPAFIMLIVVLILPRSPRWLLLKGYETEAHEVLAKVRHQDEVAPEVQEIKGSLKHKIATFEVFKNPLFIKVLILGCVLQIIQQFSGINAIIYYSGSIFSVSGVSSPVLQNSITVIVGAVNMLTTILAILLVDKWGRRPILITGGIIMIVSMLVLSLLLFEGVHNHFMLYTAIISVLTFIFGFAVSFGPIMWILCAEIFPIKGREVGITITTAMNWVCNAIVGSTFLTLLEYVGGGGTFLVFSILGLISLLVILRFVPETKGISLEQIEENLVSGKRLRWLGR